MTVTTAYWLRGRPVDLGSCRAVLLPYIVWSRDWQADVLVWARTAEEAWNLLDRHPGAFRWAAITIP
jgi:hypothetical protein